MSWTFKPSQPLSRNHHRFTTVSLPCLPKTPEPLYVVDGKYLSGIVSRKDFIKAMIGRKEVESLPIPMIMTRMPNIIYTGPTESVYDAAYKTMFYEVESLPIVTKEIDEKGVSRLVLIGKVSRTNILYPLCG